jgi:hypothetical protein
MRWTFVPNVSPCQLKQVVLDAVAEHPATFGEILDASGGAYPLDVHECVSALVEEGVLTTVGNRYAARLPTRSTIPTERSEICDAELPPPHPLDYDWRFAETSRDLLLATVLQTLPTRHVLLLGVPSLLQPLARAQPSITSAVLLDSNSSLKRAFGGCLPPGFEFVQCNLLTTAFWRPEEPVSTVVVDPPWYPAHYAAFLAQAAIASRPGATILLSLLPLNVRPEAPEERAAILELAFSLGLQLLELRRNALKYVSPPFEIASLNSQGLTVREDWRLGDLAVFKVAGAPKRDQLEVIRANAVARDPEVSIDLGWQEFEIEGRKFKIRGPFDDGFPRLISLEKGDVLPTVSRRYPGRRRVDLWLWDNRVFAVEGKQAMVSALNRLSGSAELLIQTVNSVKAQAAEKLVMGLLAKECTK